MKNGKDDTVRQNFFFPPTGRFTKSYKLKALHVLVCCAKIWENWTHEGQRKCRLMWGKKSSKDLTQDLHLTLRSIYLWLLKPRQKWSQKRPRYAKESSLESYILYFIVFAHVSINGCSYFSFSSQNIKKRKVTFDFCTPYRIMLKQFNTSFFVVFSSETKKST